LKEKKRVIEDVRRRSGREEDEFVPEITKVKTPRRRKAA